MQKKNYYFKDAYSGNSFFTTYVDGILEEENVISTYEIDTYIRIYESKGYTFGFPPEEVEKYKKEYEDAKEYYEYAKSLEF